MHASHGLAPLSPLENKTAIYFLLIFFNIKFIYTQLSLPVFHFSIILRFS